MKKGNTKQMLFEMMEKINPNFSVQEAGVAPNAVQTPNAIQTQKNIPNQPSDVKRLAKATQNTSSLLRAGEQINTTSEFPEAFRVWFSSLGYKPDNSAVSIMKVKSEIEKVMKNMGYR